MPNENERMHRYLWWNQHTGEHAEVVDATTIPELFDMVLRGLSLFGNEHALSLVQCLHDLVLERLNKPHMTASVPTATTFMGTVTYHDHRELTIDLDLNPDLNLEDPVHVEHLAKLDRIHCATAKQAGSRVLVILLDG